MDRLLPVSATDERGEVIYRLPGESPHALPFMAYAPGTFLGNVVEMLLLNAPKQCSLRRTFETHMSEAVKSMISTGNGLGWLPRSCIARELDEKTVAVAGPDSWATDLEIRIYRSAERQSTPAEEMWNWMNKHRSA